MDANYYIYNNFYGDAHDVHDVQDDVTDDVHIYVYWYGNDVHDGPGGYIHIGNDILDDDI